jgi:hypothetical protein
MEEGGEGANFKHQNSNIKEAPSTKHQAPSTKHQRSSKHQAPRRVGRRAAWTAVCRREMVGKLMNRESGIGPEGWIEIFDCD